ncbi:MAG: alpha-glucan family phosphorylase [Bacteroides sp.]|nr:alpha-glucan family phosphorylase [Bacteroides sp.]
MAGQWQNAYLFEVSWEVCNKVGGIYTVVSTKVPSMQERFGKNYFAIGPDVWKDKDNRDFIEDRHLFADWRKYAESKGIYFRIGYWNIAGKPTAIMVDYRSLIAKKDEILAENWRDYRLDSISGQWDYIEPVLFGYGAGKVIQSFYEYHVFPQEKVFAHFHEWMTGSGLLYLKKNQPQVATVFTTHATVLGRCIAGNGLPLYSELNSYNADELSNRFGVRAKFSLEKLSAVHTDCFTAVSEITHNECKAFLGQPVGVVTPNGFDDHFVPDQSGFEVKRKAARARLFKVAQAVTGQKVAEDAMFVINSGRYEFKNKGIDLFIDALAKLNAEPGLKKEVVAFICVPAGHGGAAVSLNSDRLHADAPQCCTHYLNEPDSDPILNRLRLAGLQNRPEDKVKVIFFPCYLDGEDGVFNLPYYDLLIGFDASVFPSYYEPWGYTPMESIAFSIPTLTTSLAGFGRWVRDMKQASEDGVCVIERDDINSAETVAAIGAFLKDFAACTRPEQRREAAYRLSRSFLWKQLADYYDQAYAKASAKWESHPSLLEKAMPASQQQLAGFASNQPQWRKILVNYSLPEKLEKLQALGNNLWWCWDTQAQNLWRRIDPHAWDSCGHNPLALLSSLSAGALQQLQQDGEFLNELQEVYARFEAYMAEGKRKQGPKVAYFCMEYGLHESLKIYSGGLGILAGDYMKEASDKNVDMVGIGLLYRYGYFEQQIDGNGNQNARYIPQVFSKLPLLPVRDENGQWQTVTVSLPGRNLLAKVWQVNVGRVPLYLLDTDIEGNTDFDKSITHQLYGGDWENRFKQEMLLGIGGIRMLKKLDIAPDVFHCNEGHGAFTLLERLRHYVESEHLGFWQARELVRGSSLFTTHTPVPAGHDAFDEDIVRTYLGAWASRIGITWEDFMALGRIDKEHTGDKFSMSHLAVNLSSAVNGVSRIHGRVSQEMFAPLYPGFYPDEVPVGYVTNGVHLDTWAHPAWKELFLKYFGKEYKEDVSDASKWQKIYDVPDTELAGIRSARRAELIEFVKKQLQKEWPQRGESPQNLVKVLERLDANALTLGFARRFATYKRAHLLFKNPDRLRKIVNDPQRPVQFIFAGKAHPADRAGQDLIRRIIELSRQEAFLGKIIFLENYNIDIAKHLVQGVDIWLNTPTRSMEASGTSGEKALMNGVVNFSVPDGWWAEGYRPGAGWALKEEATYENTGYQDELDAETIYSMLESEVIPAFYDARGAGSNPAWLSYVRNSIAQIAPHYTMRRQLDDYYRQYYLPLAKTHRKLQENDRRLLTDMTKWIIRMSGAWSEIRAVSYQCRDSTNEPLQTGQASTFGITLDIAGLDPGEIGVEVVFGHKVNDRVNKLESVCPMKLESAQDGQATYTARLVLDGSGVYDYAFRIFPQNEEFPNPNRFRMIRWF